MFIYIYIYIYICIYDYVYQIKKIINHMRLKTLVVSQRIKWEQ